MDTDKKRKNQCCSCSGQREVKKVHVKNSVDDHRIKKNIATGVRQSTSSVSPVDGKIASIIGEVSVAEIIPEGDA